MYPYNTIEMRDLSLTFSPKSLFTIFVDLVIINTMIPRLTTNNTLTPQGPMKSMRSTLFIISTGDVAIKNDSLNTRLKKIIRLQIESVKMIIPPQLPQKWYHITSQIEFLLTLRTLSPTKNVSSYSPLKSKGIIFLNGEELMANNYYWLWYVGSSKVS